MLPSEKVAIVDTIDPDAYAAAAVNGGWVDASEFHEFMAIVMVGDMGAGNTVDFKLQQATSAAGAGAKDISSAAITQIDQATSPETGNVQAVINLRTENLDRDNDFDYVRMVMTPGSTTSPQTTTDCGAVLLGCSPRHGPASDNDDTTVAEIVTP